MEKVNVLLKEAELFGDRARPETGRLVSLGSWPGPHPSRVHSLLFSSLFVLGD